MNNSTCPEGKLEPTYWDRADQYEYFKGLNILLSSTAPRSTSSVSPSSGSGGGSSNHGAVTGDAVGGILGFLAMVALVVFLLWRRKRAARARDSSAFSIEETKPETGELASHISAGTVPPTYSWDVNSTAPPQQTWAHAHPEVSGEDIKGTPRSLFSELHSKSSLARIVELPGAPAARELETPDATLKMSQTGSDSDMAKTPSLSVVPEPWNSSEKRWAGESGGGCKY
ncbi:uncharacterized protein M421DRAFT_417323 [Didymella exigua CBS 183.55]|uniref:Mid2 domain-containing protein n=1 Tax=Didymella exigua CBS 183.55 TaxID=1150837 RepID=A0A6A5RWI2_9PLEO|nr:uncharacterized protein M421DRAFT_417323 [Didymella exigua CBS 183.55]KAF1931554.1 hypothetical protein M421DRAFT_417323 [Didymella exigua CBS 183.55]